MGPVKMLESLERQYCYMIRSDIVNWSLKSFMYGWDKWKYWWIIGYYFNTLYKLYLLVFHQENCNYFLKQYCPLYNFSFPICCILSQFYSFFTLCRKLEIFPLKIKLCDSFVDFTFLQFNKMCVVSVSKICLFDL